MEYYDGEEGHFESSHNEAEYDEPIQSWSDEEAGYEAPPWPGDDYSSSEVEDEIDDGDFEPKPPNYPLEDSSHKSWYGAGEEDSQFGENDSEISYENEPECEEEEEVHDDSATNYEEDSYSKHQPWYEESGVIQDEDVYEETDSQISLGESKQYGEEMLHLEAEREAHYETESDYGEGDHEPRYITFSGHGHGPEAYLRWERDMEEWFSSNQIPEEEKINYAEETLTEDAFRHWDRDAYLRLEYDEPDATWEEMKQLMSDEFVRDVDNMRQYYSRVYTNPEPTRWILATRPKPKVKTKRTCSPNTKEVSTHVVKERHTSTTQAKDDTPKLAHRTVAQKPNTPVMREQQAKTNPSKSSNLSKSKEVTCYRCHKRGHYAATCPTKQVVTTLLIEPKMDNSREVTKFKSDLEFSKASMTHLSLPRDVHTDQSLPKELVEQEEEPALVTNQRKITNIAITKASNANQTKVRDYLIRFVSNDPKALMMHLMCSKELEKDLGTKEEQLDLIHKVTFEEKLCNGETNCGVRDVTKGPTLLPKELNDKSWRGVIASSLIKEEPPDSPHQLHPSHNRDIYRGNCLNPQRIQNTNLTYLHADPTILRTKFSQGGGYDEVIKPEVEPKLNQTGCTMLNRPVIDICSLFGSYQLKHEDSMHEFTWRIFSAQLQNSSKKNQVKRSSNEGVILFTNQLISSLPDLDMQALIGGLPPNQKELCYKSTCYGILVQQRRLSNWNHTKIHYGLGDIQFLKQRMLDLPYLEPAKFGGWQTKIWRPGEILEHLRNRTDHFPCTRNHWIRLILSSSIIHQDLPYLDSEGIKPQRLFSFSLGCELKTFYRTKKFLKPLSMHQDVPRLHHFQPKISRYKLTATFSIWTDFCHQSSNG